jgi:rhamnose transport system permease protein
VAGKPGHAGQVGGWDPLDDAPLDERQGARRIAGRDRQSIALLTGLMSGIVAVCLTSRLGSTRPSIAFGWELEIVTMVVLGGVNILGGSGTIVGVVIAAFVMGMVTFGLGLLNVPGIVMSIFIGLLLIFVIALPVVARRFSSRLRS